VVRWNLQLRNPSLLSPLFASVSVELVDAGGTVLAASTPVALQLEPSSSRPLSGEIRISAAAAARIVKASARVDSGR
jgi:hypothetical protein